MSDWKSEIKNRFDDYMARQLEINDALKELLKSLESEPYNFETNLIFNDGEERSWTVSIANKTSMITEKEIVNSQLRYRDEEDAANGMDPLEERGDLKESIIDLLLRKFKWPVMK